MFVSKIRRSLIGSPIPSADLHHTFIPKWKALAVLSSDALSSTAYATEEIIIPLALSGIYMATYWALPVAIGILALMVIITLSYRQTIVAYPNGGGAYIVAKENLGNRAGLVAAAALMIDYILTVSVSVSAGVENLISAFPQLESIQVFSCVWIILILMILSLRGVKESSTIFAIPTYMFVFSMATLIVVGIVRGPVEGHVAVQALTKTLPDIGLILLLRAFSSGCTALTGIEAISNGIPLFKHPQSQNANRTLVAMVLILGFLFAGITYLVSQFGLSHVENETLISTLSKTVFGNGFFYYVIQASTALILFLAASTSYADFPRLASLLAHDKYAPRQLANIGDRLVFSNGIIGLTFCAIILVILFGGRTHHLIPLYAVGVFLSFTLSQAGMVVHHYRLREKNWIWSLVMNGTGTITTAVVLVVIGAFKFTHGAWMVMLLIPIIVYIFHKIHVHYVKFAKEISQLNKFEHVSEKPIEHIVVVPISGLHRGVMNALNYGKNISNDVRVCYVKSDDVVDQKMLRDWNQKFPNKTLHMLEPSKYSITTPILKFIDQAAKEHPQEFITVIFPEFVTAKWYYHALHNQTAWYIKFALIYRKNIIVTSVKYHMSST